MQEDRIAIGKEHHRAALYIKETLLKDIQRYNGIYSITIAGESGSGKSNIARSLSQHFKKNMVKSVILQQDDYFVYPPKTNATLRAIDLGHVGLSEVRLELLEHDFKSIMDGKTKIEKPLVIINDDCIDKEILRLDGVKVVLIEGTYTSLIQDVCKHVFIDIDYHHTKKVREERGREKQNELLEKVLEIEHEIIVTHKNLADIIIDSRYRGREVGK